MRDRWTPLDLILCLGLGPGVAACGFDASAQADPACAADSCRDLRDAAAVIDGGAATADAAGPGSCAPRDGLVACFRFEGNVQDESGLANHATPSTESYSVGIDGLAITTGPTTNAAIAESDTLDVSVITIEVWLRPAAIPETGRAGIFDNEGQYGMFVLPGGAVQCNGGAISVSVAGVLAVDAWTHVACVYDGASWTLHTGGDMTVVPGGAALGDAGAVGSRLGGNAPTGDDFTGTLDELRVWSSVRTAEEICADSGDCSRP